MTSSAIISKVWSFGNTLRDDGVSYGDYLEQLTYLLFLKMADEYSRPPYNRKLTIPAMGVAHLPIPDFCLPAFLNPFNYIYKNTGH